MFVDIQLERFPSSLTEAGAVSCELCVWRVSYDYDVLKFNSSVNKIIANTVHTHTADTHIHSRHTLEESELHDKQLELLWTLLVMDAFS